MHLGTYTVCFFGFPQFLLFILIGKLKRQRSQLKNAASVAFLTGYSIKKLGESKETHCIVVRIPTQHVMQSSS